MGHFGDDFTGHKTQPTSRNTEGQWLVSQLKGQFHQAQLTNR